MGDRGLEPVDVSSSKHKDLRNSSIQSAAESGAVESQNTEIDPDLAKIIDAWPGLPNTAKKYILAIIREADGQSKG
jgi:hypothetical protein